MIALESLGDGVGTPTVFHDEVVVVESPADGLETVGAVVILDGVAVGQFVGRERCSVCRLCCGMLSEGWSLIGEEVFRVKGDGSHGLSQVALQRFRGAGVFEIAGSIHANHVGEGTRLGVVIEVEDDSGELIHGCSAG